MVLARVRNLILSGYRAIMSAETTSVPGVPAEFRLITGPKAPSISWVFGEAGSGATECLKHISAIKSDLGYRIIVLDLSGTPEDEWADIFRLEPAAVNYPESYRLQLGNNLLNALHADMGVVQEAIDRLVADLMRTDLTMTVFIFSHCTDRHLCRLIGLLEKIRNSTNSYAYLHLHSGLPDHEIDMFADGRVWMRMSSPKYAEHLLVRESPSFWGTGRAVERVREFEAREAIVSTPTAAAHVRFPEVETGA